MWINASLKFAKTLVHKAKNSLRRTWTSRPRTALKSWCSISMYQTMTTWCRLTGLQIFARCSQHWTPNSWMHYHTWKIYLLMNPWYYSMADIPPNSLSAENLSGSVIRFGISTLPLDTASSCDTVRTWAWRVSCSEAWQQFAFRPIYSVFDNFFTSLPLLEQHHATGTVCVNRIEKYMLCRLTRLKSKLVILLTTSKIHHLALL